MSARRLDVERDMPAVAMLLGRTRAAGGLTHPGGTQWWLRELANDDRDDFDAFVWEGASGLVGFALVDGTFVVLEHIAGGDGRIGILEFLEDYMRTAGRASLTTHVADGDPVQSSLEANGYCASDFELELVAKTVAEPPRAPLPDGFRFTSLDEVDDATFIDGHRAAWSDTKPSPYRRALHEAVKKMPQFRPDLVTIALAPDGTVASYCIGWMDAQSATLEIEPLGTHRNYRRLGLAHAVVREVQRRAWRNGAKEVVVWNHPQINAPAYALYTGAGMPQRRRLVELTKQL